MQLLDHLVIHHGSEEHSIELYHGDLTAMSPEEQVDILVISAFPFNYAPSPGTLMGALYDKGVSVYSLAQHPALDLRETFSCWLSDKSPILACSSNAFCASSRCCAANRPKSSATSFKA